MQIGKILSVITLLTACGCAHYYLPASHLETPEACGSGRVGRLELLSVQSGTDLIAPAQLHYPTPSPSNTPPPVAVLQQDFANYVFGFDVALASPVDLGIRLGFDLPLTFRGKYQIYGAPENSTTMRGFAAAIVVSPGIVASDGVLYGLVDMSVPVGYRIWQNHLFSLTPFLTWGGISGVSIPAVPSATGTSSPATSAASFDQYGISLGYEYSVMALHLRAELAYIAGAMQTAEIGGFSGAGSVGFNL